MHHEACAFSVLPGRRGNSRMLYQKILDRIVEQSKQILKEALTGVCLHGAMAMGCFQPNKSDIEEAREDILSNLVM